ncbi:MAG: hypothetical protein ABH858_01115 [Candidatus Omnitrophota bacterium]
MEYPLYSTIKERQYELLCRRCGACCGVFDDPCVHLKSHGKDSYYCDAYHSRFGPRKTIGGKEFNCVPVRELLSASWPMDYLCPYKKSYER